MDSENKLVNELGKYDFVSNTKNYNFSRDAEPSGDASGMWSSEIKAFADASTLKSLFFGEDWVFIVNDLIANKISNQTLEIVRVITDEEGSQTEEVNDSHPLMKLFEQPNELQDYHSWMYNYVVDLTLLGNAINWQSPRTGNIHILPADRITIDFDDRRDIKSYLMADNSDDRPQLMDMHAFDPKEIFHTRRPNPASLIWGLSPFVPGRKSILFNRYSTDYLNSFYLKGATPGVALSLDKVANEESSLRMLRSFEMAYTGRRNMRRPLILPKGVDIKTLTHTLADQRLVEMIDKNRESLLSILKVPKHEVGLQTAGSLGSEEYKTALRNFWESTLIPTMKMISGMMNKFFAKDLGEDNYIRFNLDDISALQEDKSQKADLAIKQLQFMTINEVRQELYDLEPIAGGDKPLSLNANVGFSAGSELSSPFANIGAGSDQQAQEEDEEQTEVEERSVKKLDSQTMMEKYKFDISYHMKQIDEESNKTAEKILEYSLDMFSDMAGIAIKVLKKSAKATTAPRLKADDLPSAELLARRIKKGFEDELEEDYVENNVKTLGASYDLGFESQLSVVFNQPNQDAIRAVAARNDRKRALLEARGIESFASVSKTHTDRIMNQVKLGLERSESVDKITDRIAKTFRDPDTMFKKAETIARTETLHAVSQGQWATATAAKEVIPGLQKRWITAGDDRVRDDHVSLDGDVVDVDKDFQTSSGESLAYPRDVKGSAGNVINCFVAEANVQSHGALAAYKRIYEGDLVTIKLCDGAEFTGTPNHPMLTLRGWVPLGKLQKTDKLLKGSIADGSFVGDHNIEGMPSKFGELYTSLSESGDVQRVSGGVLDFHGDGIASNVDVIGVNSHLMNSLKLASGQSGNEIGLGNPNFAQSALLLNSRLNQSIGRVSSSHSSVGSSNLGGSLGRSHSVPFRSLGSGSSSMLKSKHLERSNNGYAANTKLLRKFVDAQAFADVKIVNISNLIISKNSRRHVYNLSTVNEMYLVDGFITHNCRCSMILVPPEE